MIELFRRIAANLARRALALHDEIKVRAGSTVVHGPANVPLADDQCAVVSLMKNAEWFIESFLEHHFALGVAHIVIVDNGSTDRTVEIAARFERVTVVHNSLPAKRYECLLRTINAHLVLRGGWVLFADSDEMLEVPFVATPFPNLLKYCNQEGFTAVVGQMLDLFSPLPYGEQAKMNYPDALATCRFYSTEKLEPLAYHDPNMDLAWFLRENACDDLGVMLFRGGLRAEVFDETPFLSKHSLVRNTADVALMTHPHCAGRVRVADLTLCLRHYKLAGPWLARDRASHATRTWDHGEDARRLQKVMGDRFCITPVHSREWAGPDFLLEEGLLYASARARAALANSPRSLPVSESRVSPSQLESHDQR